MLLKRLIILKDLLSILIRFSTFLIILKIGFKLEFSISLKELRRSKNLYVLN